MGKKNKQKGDTLIRDAHASQNMASNYIKQELTELQKEIRVSRILITELVYLSQ